MPELLKTERMKEGRKKEPQEEREMETESDRDRRITINITNINNSSCIEQGIADFFRPAIGTEVKRCIFLLVERVQRSTL